MLFSFAVNGNENRATFSLRVSKIPEFCVNLDGLQVFFNV